MTGDAEARPAVTAERCEATADHLAEATLCLERLNYNVLTHDELQEVLAAHDTLGEICLRYRRQQPPSTEGGE